MMHRLLNFLCLRQKKSFNSAKLANDEIFSPGVFQHHEHESEMTEARRVFMFFHVI